MYINNFLKRENNNLTIIRVILSCMVIYYHSYALTGNDPNRDVIKQLFNLTTSGGLAVSIFFFISGLLVTDSYLTHGNHIRFLLSRFFRIIPALFVLLVITVFIVAPLITSVSLYSFFSDKSNYYYVLNNLLMNTRFYLSGVFDKNHYPSVINGSLWTLKWEVICYLFLLCFGMIDILKNKTLSSLICLFMIFSSELKLEWLVFIMGDNAGIINLPMYFSIGSLFAIWKDEIYISLNTIIGLILLTYMLKNSYFYILLFYTTSFSLVIYAASNKFIKKIRLDTDPSYGIYIYGFLIQQIISFEFPNMKFYTNSLLSITLCLLLGILSFKHIEKPAIQLGRRLSKQLLNKYNRVAGGF